jgi:cytochrome c oxidase subunit 4
LRHDALAGDAPDEEHVVSPRVYVAVFATLLLMTATTTAVSYVDLGPWSTVVALGIAVFKATLVVLFFMHVKYGSRLTQIIIGGALLWLAIMLALTLSDFMTRGWVPVFRQFEAIGS